MFSVRCKVVGIIYKLRWLVLHIEGTILCFGAKSNNTWMCFHIQTQWQRWSGNSISAVMEQAVWIVSGITVSRWLFITLVTRQDTYKWLYTTTSMFAGGFCKVATLNGFNLISGSLPSNRWNSTTAQSNVF